MADDVIHRVTELGVHTAAQSRCEEMRESSAVLNVTGRVHTAEMAGQVGQAVPDCGSLHWIPFH